MEREWQDGRGVFCEVLHLNEISPRAVRTGRTGTH
jgi:hypothetical protein